MNVRHSSTTNKTIVLQVTENCNLHCVYCYQHTKRPVIIEEPLLKQIIQDSFINERSFKRLEFNLIGGEPLLCMPLIKQICEWTWSKPRPIEYVFSATTNGVGIKEEDKEWFRQHKDRFSLCLSVDGTKTMHDTNRSNSYDRIDLDFFLKTWPKQKVKMTVSPQTIDTFAEGVIDLQEKGFDLTANLAYGVDWSGKDLERILERELKKLINYYLDNEDKEPFLWLRLPLHKLAENNNQPEWWCGAGLDTIAYDVHGKVLPCQLFYGTTGDSMTGCDQLNLDEALQLYYDHCKVKPLFNICPLCIGMAYSSKGNSFECNTQLCRLIQVFFRANAYFQSQKILLKKRIHDLVDIDMQKMVKGIHVVNDTENLQ